MQNRYTPVRLRPVTPKRMHLTRRELERLVDAGWTVEALEQLAAVVGDTQIAVTLDYLAAQQSVRRLAADVERAASRIHGLVSAVKRFTYMDQAMVAAPTELAAKVQLHTRVTPPNPRRLR